MKLKTVASALLILLFVSHSFAQKKVFKTQIDSVSYSLGISIGENLRKMGVNSLNTKLMAQAIDNVFASDTALNKKAKNQKLLTLEQSNKTLQNYFMALEKAKASEQAKAGEKFMEDAKKKAGVQSTEDGILYEVINAGTGPKPTLSDTITAHYKGSLIDGTVFDSSIERGEPATFPLGNVIPGWQEVLQLMPVGSKWKVIIPSKLGYGEQGAGEMIKPNSVLIFEIELIEIKGKK